jgi:hypothetical protein
MGKAEYMSELQVADAADVLAHNRVFASQPRSTHEVDDARSVCIV